MTCPGLGSLLAAAAATEGGLGADHLDRCERCRAIALAARRHAAELAHPDVSCDAVEPLLAELDDGAALGLDDQARLLAHFVVCESCRAFVTPEPPDTGDPAPPLQGPLPVVPHSTYRFEEELARGGMGHILRAIDCRLGRTVAVKEVLPDGRRSFAEERACNARLEREARITASLNHPSIVSVHEAGYWPRGTPFFAMNLVAGRSLAHAIAAAGTLEGRLALLPHVIAAAEALAYAHSVDVIHRDLKPANVIVGNFGETVVIDWGLAKDLRQPTADETTSAPDRAPLLTQAGAAVGTPAYMPPEQARGEPADRTADVYALGGMLYHLLTGRPPHAGGQPAELPTRAPRSVTELEPRVPRALATIVAKAMEHEPRDRYPSAGELAADLRRFQTGQLVQAHEYALVELVHHWFAHRRVSVVLAVALAAALLVSGVVGVRGILGERDRATAAAERAERTNERLILARAREVIARDPTAALAWLRRLPIREDNWLDAHAVAAEADAAGTARAILEGHDATVYDVQVSADGRTAVSGDADGELRVWDLAGGSVRRLGDEGALVAEMALSPDGRTVAVAGDRGLGLWDLRTGARRELAGHRGPVHTVAFAGGGRELVTGGKDGTARRWALDTGAARVLAGEEADPGASIAGTFGARSVLTFHAAAPDVTVVITASGRVIAVGPDGGVRWQAALPGGKLPTAASLSPRGDELATYANGELRRWRVDSGESRALPAEDVYRLVHSPDGRWLAASSRVGVVQLWDLRDGGTQTLHGHTTQSYGVAFSRDGAVLASSGHDGTVRVWTPDHGEIWTLRGHKTAVPAVAFGADGVLLSLAVDGTARLWRPAARATRSLPSHAGTIHRVRTASGAAVALTAGRDGILRIWDLVALACQPVAHGAQVVNAWLAPDGAAALSTDADQTCRLWRGGALTVVGERAACAEAGTFAPDGRSFATLDRQRTLRLWQADDLTRPALEVKGVIAPAFASSGELLYVTSDGAIMRRAPGGEPREVARTPAPVNALWSADGRVVVVGAEDTFVVVDLERDREMRMPAPPGATYRDVAPDGRLFAVGDVRGRVHVLDTATGITRVLAGHALRVAKVAVSNQGRWAASASEGDLLLWDLETGRHRRLHGHPEWVNGLAFTADNRQLMSVGTDGTIRLWSAELASPLPASPADVARELAAAPALGDDDELVITR